MRGLTELFEALICEMKEFCENNNLPHMSADELAAEETTTDAQRKWLYDFIERWESACEQEREFLTR